jgi:hypothetical protein
MPWTKQRTWGGVNARTSLGLQLGSGAELWMAPRRTHTPLLARLRQLNRLAAGARRLNTEPVSEPQHSPGAIERALADMEHGHRSRARRRLKSYLVNHPTSMDARRLLTELYRADRHPDEAGRWGYLLRDGATTAERAAYERACAYRLTPDWTATYLRKGLHWNAPVESADDYAIGILRQLDARAAAEAEDYRRAIDAMIWNRIGRAITRLRRWVGARTGRPTP